MSQQRPSMPRRPGGGSRQGASRPRRVAGQSDRPEQGSRPGPGAGDRSGAGSGRGRALLGRLRRRRGTDGAAATGTARSRWSPRRRRSDGEDAATAGDSSVSGLLASPRATVVLGLTAMVLVLVAVLIAGYTWRGWLLSYTEEPTVSADRPVVVGELVHREGADAAAKHATEILSTDYAKYGAEREEALGLMTDAFAQEYSRTLDDIKQDFVQQETRISVTVVGQGVVRADSEEVQALLFLNQFVEKKGQQATQTPYRALVTVTDTEEGWLVSDLETK